MWKSIDKNEKKVLMIAALVSAGHLFLIAYAAIFLHITVPTCQAEAKNFDKPSIFKVSDSRYEVHYVAKMWTFEPKKIIVPKGAQIDFYLASTDVNHGFHVHDTNVNLMAVPGVVNKATHTFNKIGTYPIVCHEYCGFGHQNMTADIIVSDTATDISTGEVEAPGQSEDLPPEVLAGKEIYTNKGCVGCHSLDGTPGVGPSFKGLWGHKAEMTDGSIIEVDEAYVAESISNPNAKLVKGFAPVMPPLGLTDEEIKNFIAYLKTL